MDRKTIVATEESLKEVQWKTDKMAASLDDTRDTVESMAGAIAQLRARINMLEVKVSLGHKAPTHWEGRL